MDIHLKLRHAIDSCDIDDVSKKMLIDNSALTEMSINSMDFIKIVVAIENEFDIEFDDDALNSENYVNLKDIGRYIETLLTEN